MKVLYLTGGIGISETFIYELALGLKEKHHLDIFTFNKPYYTDGLNYRLIKNDLPLNLEYYLSYLFENRGKKIVYRLKKFITSYKIEKYITKYNIVFIEYGTNAVLILPALIKYKIPFVVHFHGFDITSQLNFKVYKDDLKLVFKYDSAVIAASNHVKRLLVLNGLNEEKINVIRLGISITQIQFNNMNYQPIDFIFIGRLTPKKNPLALILAFNICLKHNSTLNLHIVGDGELMQDCKLLVNNLRINNSVFFHGSLEHKNAIDILMQSKIYVQHSVTSLKGDQEGFAISLAEAALLKIPVISTYHNGIPENVIDGETGFLVREFDYETMADKMIELINNPELRKKMGENGHKHIKNICNSSRRIESISKLLESFI